MAEAAPVAAPPESEKSELPPTEDSADKAPEPETSTTDDKPAESANVTSEKKDSEPVSDKKDVSGDATDAKGDGEDATAATADDEAAPETNGTPASTKKTAKDRRRSSGVGEKKLNRKKSMTRVTHLNAKPGDYFLARLKTYAPWPAIICDEDILPVSLLETRPVSAANEDGKYREDYADDGKRAHERTYPVMFFESNEFAWVVNTNLTPLDPSECKGISEKNKTKRLLAAYEVAAQGHDLSHFKKVLAEHQNALDEEIREQEEREAAKANKAQAKADKAAEKAAEKNKKTKRKSKAAETDVEMEDAEDTKKPKGSAKKRKNDADAETEKPAKTPKTTTKIKLTTPKAAAEESGKKAPASKGKKATKKGKAAASDEEEKASSKEPEKQANPEELKKKKEKEVLFLRHKLQKGFISRDQPPKEDEMATMSTYFDKLEKHADLEVSIIRTTKINKVLKMIVKLNSIPRDEEFKFRERAMSILSNWKNVLDTDAPADGSKPTNGTKDEDAADTPKLETEAEADDEKEKEKNNTNDDTPMPDADLKDESAIEKTVPETETEPVTEEKTEEKEKEAATEADA